MKFRRWSNFELRQEWPAVEKSPQPGGRACKVSFNPLCLCCTKRSRSASKPFDSCFMQILFLCEKKGSLLIPLPGSKWDVCRLIFFGRRLNICRACALCCLFLVLLFFWIFFVTHPTLQIQPRSFSARVLWLKCAAHSRFSFFLKKNNNHLHKRKKALRVWKCHCVLLTDTHTSNCSPTFSNNFLFFVLFSSLSFSLSLSLSLQFRLQIGRLDFASHQEHQALRLGQKSNVKSSTWKSAWFISSSFLFHHLITA